MYMKYIVYKIRTAEMKSNEEWSTQLWLQFMQLRKKPEKNSTLQRDLNPWPRDSGIQHFSGFIA